MSAVAATVWAPTLAESLDALALLARGEAPVSCLWCGSAAVDIRRSGGGSDDGVAATYVTICRACGSELSSERPATSPGWRP